MEVDGALKLNNCRCPLQCLSSLLSNVYTIGASTNWWKIVPWICHSIERKKKVWYPHTKPTSPCHIIIMLRVWLGSDKYHLHVIVLTQVGFEPMGLNPMI